MADVLTYDALGDVLADLGLAHTPAGYHGLLAAALCIAPSPGDIDVLRLDHGDTPAPAEAGTQASLAALREATAESLSGFQGGFQPLLPQDDEPLAARAEALAQWCEGFTFGLASQGRFELEAHSPEVREIVHDLSEMTRAGGDEMGDEEEAAYADLVEYVRVGVQLIYVELHHRSLH